MATRHQPILALLQKYIERDPQMAATLMQSLNDEDAMTVLKVLPAQLMAKVFPYLHGEYASELLESLSPDLVSEIVKKMSPEQAALVLLIMSKNSRQVIIDQLPFETKLHIQDLLTYPEDSAGRIMSTRYTAFSENIRVKDAVGKLRSLAGKQIPTTYTYIVDSENRLKGIASLYDLLIANGDTLLSSIMKKDVYAINGFMDREEVAQVLARKHFFAAPVVDNDGRLIGVVKTDQIIDHVQEESTEDILKMAGVSSDERTDSSVGFSLKKRLPWLHINLVTAFFAAGVVAIFEDIIARITVLAIFLPVVAGQGGNAGAQSLAIVMRGLVLREIKPSNSVKFIIKETWIGALNGIIIGLVTALAAWLWNGNPFLGIVIGTAMIVNLTAAGLSGAAIPIIMKALRLDPAQSSSIIITTITDVVGFFAFLGIAVIFQSRLA